MPDDVLSTAIREAYASAPSGDVVVHTLEIYHPDFNTQGEFTLADTIRIVRDFSNFTGTLEATAPRGASTSVTFLAYAFDFTPPEVTDGAAPVITITLDNASADMIRMLEKAILSATPIEVIYRVWLASDTSAPQNDPPLIMKISEASATVGRIVAKARLYNFANRSFPGKTWTKEFSPSLANTPT